MHTKRVIWEVQKRAGSSCSGKVTSVAEAASSSTAFTVVGAHVSLGVYTAS